MKTIYNIGLSTLGSFLKEHHQQITEDEALALKRKPKGKRLVIQCYRKNGTVSSSHLNIGKETPEIFIDGTILYIQTGGSYEFFLVPLRFTEMKKLSEANSSEMRLNFLKKNANLIKKPTSKQTIPNKIIVRVEQDRYITEFNAVPNEIWKDCSYYSLDNNLV